MSRDELQGPAQAADARRARAAAEAAGWAIRLDAEKLSVTETAEFFAWLRESPIHVAESLRLSRMEAALAEFDGWSEVASTTQPPQDHVVPIIRAMVHAYPERLRRSRLGPARIIVLAASAAVLAAIGLWASVAPTTLESGSRDQRQATLADGSTVVLKPSTELRVQLEPDLRSITLERGEARFQVAKDPTRPFVVHAAHTEVVAVGTVFTVARQTEGIVVAVTEGRVAVVPNVTRVISNGGSDEHTSISLQANESVTISSRGMSGAVQTLRSPGTAAVTPVRPDKQFFFDHAQVRDVVNQFNRRNRLQLRVTDPALGSRIVSGIFDADDPISFADFLTAIAGATRADVTHEEIVVAPGGAHSDAEPPSR